MKNIKKKKKSKLCTVHPNFFTRIRQKKIEENEISSNTIFSSSSLYLLIYWCLEQQLSIFVWIVYKKSCFHLPFSSSKYWYWSWYNVCDFVHQLSEYVCTTPGGHYESIFYRYSCVGVWKDGHVEIVANEQGNRTTPSIVAFTDTHRLIGEPAKAQMTTNPENTVFDAKRLIGRYYYDSTVQADLKHWPFNIIADESKKIKIEVHYKGQIRRFYPGIPFTSHNEAE